MHQDVGNKKAQSSLIRVFETRSHECPGGSSSHSLRVGDRTFTQLPGYSSGRVVHHASSIQWQPGDSNAAWQVCLTRAEASSTSSPSVCNVAAKTRWLRRMVADTSPPRNLFHLFPKLETACSGFSLFDNRACQMPVLKLHCLDDFTMPLVYLLISFSQVCVRCHIFGCFRVFHGSPESF